MPTRRTLARSLTIFLLVLLAPVSSVARGAPAPGAAAPRGSGPDVIRFRFAWPAPLEAKVGYRRTRTGAGEPSRVFTSRYLSRAERSGAALHLATLGTQWKGDLPFPARFAEEAIRASEGVVQVVGSDGEFGGLEGAEAMRPVLTRVFEDARVPGEQLRRAVALAEGSMRAEAEELWNLAVGFWTEADLELGETYVMQTESEIPLLPGTRVPHELEFSVRRRVPCAAGQREARCVEVTLRATPDATALARASRALLARLAPPDAPLPPEAARDLGVESTLLLVTEPDTLLPHRLVWTKAVRVSGPDADEPLAEVVDRSEYDYRYPPPPAPPRTKAMGHARARHERAR